MSKVCYTALFGNYEELKTPKVITPGWRYICYTDQYLKNDVWEIIPMRPTMSNKMSARYLKILGHSEEEQSIWVDASFWIDTNLDDWWAKYFKAPFSAPKHPLRDDCDEEILACILSQNCDLKTLQAQREAYKDVPRHNGIITSGILMRTPEAKELCQAWWDELCKWSTRDQVAFAKVSQNFEFHTYQWDYRKEKDFIYWHHFNRR